MFEASDRGATDVIAWFSHWPTFHDAEVLSITLDGSGECGVAIHAFEMTPEVNTDGHYVLAKHAVVTFCLEGFPQDQRNHEYSAIVRQALELSLFEKRVLRERKIRNVARGTLERHLVEQQRRRGDGHQCWDRTEGLARGRRRNAAAAERQGVNAR